MLVLPVPGGPTRQIRPPFISGESCFTAPGIYEHSVVIIGGEPSGSHVEQAQSINIPMPGNYESINAAQAATVLLFEYVRRMSLKKER